MNKWLIAIALVSVIAASGCAVNNSSDNANYASRKCQDLCVQLLATRIDVTKGPCLSDNIAGDWVCDMAHSPRTAEDDDPTNQCPSFGAAARHFVEVSENCRVLRVV